MRRGLVIRNRSPAPHYQGALDGLCGVYATVNAVSRMSDVRKGADELFIELCRFLDARRELGKILTSGTWFRQVCRIVDVASDWLWAQNGLRLSRRVASRASTLDLDLFWSMIAGHIEENGSGSVLLGMSGVYDHWTCVDRISDARITLFDSDHLNHLNRKNCTTGVANRMRRHALYPSQTLLLTLSRDD